MFAQLTGVETLAVCVRHCNLCVIILVENLVDGMNGVLKMNSNE